MIRFHNEKLEVERENQLVLAYMNAMWTAQWFGKKKPIKLEKLLKKKPKVMSDNEMLEQVKRLNKLFGGTVKNETSQEGSEN